MDHSNCFQLVMVCVVVDQLVWLLAVDCNRSLCLAGSRRGLAFYTALDHGIGFDIGRGSASFVDGLARQSSEFQLLSEFAIRDDS